MKRNQRKMIMDRCSDWGHWKDQQAILSGYPNKSTTARISEVGVRVENSYIDVTTGYRINHDAKEVDQVIRNAKKQYQDIANYLWVGRNTVDKSIEVKELFMRNQWFKISRRGKLVLKFDHFEEYKDKMLKYFYNKLFVDNQSFKDKVS